MQYLLIILSLLSLSFSQTYCAGDQINSDDQDFEFEVCYASDGYNLGDTWKLSDYNGDLNGGDYHIIFIDMSASW